MTSIMCLVSSIQSITVNAAIMPEVLHSANGSLVLCQTALVSITLSMDKNAFIRSALALPCSL
jgi:hypothetical protein